jgi:hypothetical protein
MLEYRNIEGFPGYRVGNDGSVWSSWEVVHPYGVHGSTSRITDFWKRLKPNPARGGYLAIHFRKDGKAYRFLIHRVVLSAFIGTCPEGMECCHDDGNRTNNQLSNLRWDTPKANCADRVRHGTAPCGPRNPNAKVFEADAAELRRIKSEGGNVRVEAQRFGISPEHAHRVAAGKTYHQTCKRN